MKTGLRISVISFFLGGALSCFAQQLPNYTQFNLNTLGMNPAAGGTHLGLEFWAGRRNQWIGFPDAPIQTFASGVYTFRNNFNYKAVHSLGFYAEQDNFGQYSNKSSHIFYAIHLKISRGWKTSFGLFAGMRSIGLSNSLFLEGDPALATIKKVVYLYPDFVPGWRLYSKSLFFDVAVRNLYKNKVKQGSNQVGTNSILVPQAVLMVGYRIHTATNDFVFTPMIKVQGAVTQPPAVDLFCVAHYRKRIGLGLSYRVASSAAVMFQVRIKSNIILAFSYEYATSRIRKVAPGSTEVIFGFSPIMGTDGERPRTNDISACPEFDF
jgi:type IX secretion system PorP/SprF family membrane protein